MELDLRRSSSVEESTNTSSDEMFSFPGTPSSDFEFGCVTPTSPTSTTDGEKQQHVSPADQFFLNGKLLPHSFQPTTTTQSSRSSISEAPANFPIIKPSTTSRTSSIRSSNKEDSLMSSRSNSTSSSRSSGMTTTTTTSSSVSCSSSARTSSSDLSERRAFQNRMAASRTMSARERSKMGSYECMKRGYCGNNNNHRCRGHRSGSSQRWQFIISPVPVLEPCSLTRRRRSTSSGEQTMKMMSPKNKKNKKKKKDHVADTASTAVCKKEVDGGKGNDRNGGGRWSGFLERTLRSVVKSCKACHAMDQANVDDRDEDELVSCHIITEVKG